MAKKTLANTETDRDVDEFLSQIKNRTRKADSLKLAEIIREIKGIKPKIWGKSIVGYGKYEYSRKNGDTYEWFHVGFSPGSAHLSIYLMFDISAEAALLEKLGPHGCGKGCLYIKRLDDINLDILKGLIAKSDRW